MQNDSAELQFQNFPRESTNHNNSIGPSVHHSHTVSMDNISDPPDLSDVQSDEDYSSSGKTSSSKSFWTFEYYQQFFDVDTDEVKNRIIWGMIPRPGISYLQNVIKPNPDLYGPFWICITLIFIIAVSGNVANYLQFAQDGNFEWKYDFHLISYAATAIFTYAWIVPLVLWVFLKSQNILQKSVNFLDLLCVYGYSLGIYIPVSILWVIQISWFQWLLVLVGATFSGFVLLTTIGLAVEGGKKYLIIAVVISLHFLLAVGFMLYFFHVPSISEIVTTETITQKLIVAKTNNSKIIHKQS